VEFRELIRTRYSVRAYRSTPVTEEVLLQVLEAAQLAPTAANRQAFQLVVVHTAGREAELKRIYDRDWFVQAPVILCACGLPAENWVRRDAKNFNDVDVAIVMDHLILAAANLGLGTCWIGAFDPVAAREVLGLPLGVEPIVFTPLGYPADQLKPKKRKPISELVRYEHWWGYLGVGRLHASGPTPMVVARVACPVAYKATQRPVQLRDR
jgi:nitroreductase